MTRVTMVEIIKVVSAYYKVSEADIIGKSRRRCFVRPRQIAGYLCKDMTPRSYPEIGRKLGGRDHSTIIHGCRVIEHLIKTDTDMRRDVEALRSSLGYHAGIPCNDNEASAEAIAARQEYFRQLAERRRQTRLARARKYLTMRQGREFLRRLETMDDMALMDFNARQYLKQSPVVRMAE